MDIRLRQAALTSCVALAAALLDSPAAVGQSPPMRPRPEQGRVAALDSAIETALLAQRLARYGRATRSPLSLVAAAQILLDNPPRALEEEGGATTAPGDTAVARAQLARDFDARSLLAEARALAGTNQPLIAIVAQLEQRAESQARGQVRGTANGPRQRYGQLAPGARHVHGITFTRDQPAVVYVSADGAVPLELAVYDARGARLAFDRGPGGRSVVRWRPARTARFTVQVRNRGADSTWYVLLTN